MTEPAAKAIAGKVAAKKTATTRPATKSTPKKLATTRPGPKSEVPSKPEAKKEPAKKTTNRVVKAGKNTVQKQARYYAPVQRPVKSVVTYRHMVAAEYVLGLLLILTQKSDFKQGDKETIGVLLQASSFTFVWIVLFGITSGGRTAARFSAALGGLIVLTLAVKQANIFDRFAGLMNHDLAGKATSNA